MKNENVIDLHFLETHRCVPLHAWCQYRGVKPDLCFCVASRLIVTVNLSWFRMSLNVNDVWLWNLKNTLTVTSGNRKQYMSRVTFTTLHAVDLLCVLGCHPQEINKLRRKRELQELWSNHWCYRRTGNILQNLIQPAEITNFTASCAFDKMGCVLQIVSFPLRNSLYLRFIEFFFYSSQAYYLF